MNLLVTSGNTQTPIDKVRCITNIFTGRTGTGIALRAHQHGHDVTLLTSHPEVVAELCEADHPLTERFTLRRYRTFDDLQTLMAEHIQGKPLDAVIHCAAVSDYRAAGIYAPAAGTRFREAEAAWEGAQPRLHDLTAGKVKSDAEELWLRLVRTPKLVDLIRRDWGFRGVLVKFKLEVGVSDERLLEIAEKSRVQSAADLMTANTLEGAAELAFLGPIAGQYQRVPRRELAQRLLEAVEARHRERALMANVLLGVTGSVAAILTPQLFQRLREAGHQVKVVATTASLYFFDPRDLDPSRPQRNREIAILDEDEWPGRDDGRRWQRGEPVLHIELRRWAEIFVIAPLDANTLAKLANGLSDNCLTCVWRAWDTTRPVVLAPAMNTLMWEHPQTRRHLEQLNELMNQQQAKLTIVAPQSKQLACGDVGVGAMAALDEIVQAVCDAGCHALAETAKGQDAAPTTAKA